MTYQSLKEIVYNYISDEIRNKNLNPNEKISEQKICSALGISRTPVREALIELCADGLLESNPRRGFKVRALTLKEAEDLYAVLANLDFMAAVLAIDFLTEEDYKKMENLIKKMNTSIANHQFTKYYEQQIQFHDIYIFKTHNEVLIETILKLRKRFIRQSYKDEESVELQNILTKTNSEHSQIIELMKNKQIQELEQCLRYTHWSLNYAEMDSLY